MRDSYQRLIFSVLGRPAVNRIVRAALKPLAFLIPKEILQRIPVVAEVHIPLPSGREVVLVSDGTDQIASKIYWGGLSGYEPGTIAVYLHLIEKCTTVIDVGANTGLFSLLAAVAGDGVEVHAFEPVRRVYACLLKNIERNRVSSVRAVCKAAADHDGMVSFYEPRTVMLPSSASLCSGRDVENIEEVLLPAVTLDSYVKEHHVRKVDLIKVDVEGAEASVFRGVGELIRRDRPAVLCEVLRGTDTDFLQTFFGEAGYVFFRVTTSGPVAEELITGGTTEEDWNYLFVPRESSSELLHFLSAGAAL